MRLRWVVAFAIIAELTFANQTFNIKPLNAEEIVTEEDKHEPEPESSEEEDNIVWFSQINRVTSAGQYIDITLNKLEVEENCYFLTPNGEDSTKQTEINGVKVHDSSDYVSCRITVGPMEASLVGVWALCGKYTDDEEHERCQRVNIAWYDSHNPSITWQRNTQRLFNHSVSLGEYLRPIVIGSDTTETCHVITPNGEDLVLTDDMDYPKIQRRAGSSDSCAVSIGPIETSTLGSWTLYGQFRSIFIFSEVRLPMNMLLYDEENPFTQPYNVTNLNPISRVINLGTSITPEVTGSGNIDSCQYRVPSGQWYRFNESEQFHGVTIDDVGNTVVCRISIGPITTNMLGEWQIIGQFSNNGIFTERRQIFNIIQEDPENPIIEDRSVDNLTQQFYNTHMGTNKTITIPGDIFYNPQSCHIRTPSGRQYTFMDGFNVLGVTVITGRDIECGVNIDVFSEDMVGEWVLIARASLSSLAVERRQPFVIYVEEQVEAFPRELAIAEGSDLYVRLSNPTEQYDTCKLVGPQEDSSSTHDIDTSHSKSCGFVVKNVAMKDEGIWQIVYGARILYRAPVNVTVIETGLSKLDDMILIKDRAVNTDIGPENAVYCKLIDPTGLAVFDDFGTCRLVIERVTMGHNGYWMMIVGSPGRILALKHQFFVRVKEADPKAVVITRVQRQQPSVVLSCSVAVTDNVRACKFRDTSGNILMANQGVGEDRFIFHGSEISVTSDLRSHECGLRITDPSEEDLGLWRCGIETDVDTYYGFLTVICPWLMQNSENQISVVTEPELQADRSSISAMEGESLTMSCSIQSAIRYCYFRSWNGTVFSVTPATSSVSMEYVGSGFDAGECGVRFNDRVAGDSGMWSCHIGLINETKEYRARFNVDIREPMEVRHYMHLVFGLVVEAKVNGDRHLDYCRFVRSDGAGFTTDFIPEGYTFMGSLNEGYCLLRIFLNTNNIHSFENQLNLNPWTIAVKIRGQELELSRQTTPNFAWINLPPGGSDGLYIWIIVVILGITFLMIGLSFGPEKNRKWTYERASQLRNSIRSSFRKTKPIENA